MFKKSAAFSASLIAMLLTACGETGVDRPPQATGPDKEPEPVALVMLQDGATITDEEFNTMIAAPVHAKYPHMTVRMVRNAKGNDGIGDLIAGGDFPDFIFTTYPQIKVHKEMGTAADLTELIKSSGMDIGKFDPAAMETARVYSGGNSLYAIPFSLNFLALFYNKDLFDRFGVEYPKDGATWDEVIRLANRFSRTEGGVSYKGLLIPGAFDLSTQLSLPYVNAQTKKAAVNTDGWKRIFQLIKTVSDIPGNKGANLDDFLVKQSLAMVASYDARIAALEKLHGTPGQFNWDITQFPSYPDRPNTSLASSGHFLMVSALSKHKDEAFRAIYLLTGEENQNLITEHGRFTSLNNQGIKNKYGVNTKSLQGKNIKAVFQSAFAPPYQPTAYDKFVPPRINAAVKSVVEGQIDINSAIRQAEEEINLDIAAAP